jgi:AcrR family transcriptional regulator
MIMADEGRSAVKPGKRTYKKSALTRERIYKEAMSQMSENGFQGTTIRSVCDRAKVSVGTFYNYFSSKGDILQDIYHSADELFRVDVARQLEGKTCEEQLRTFALRYAQLNTDTGLDVMRVLFNPENTWFSKRRPMQEVLHSIIEKGQQDGVIRSDHSAASLVENIFVMLRGVCYAWCVANASFSLKDRMSEMIDLFLGGILTKSGKHD